MITNLFSIFDPSTPGFLSSNWLSSFIFVLLVPITLWNLYARPHKLTNLVSNYISIEFKPLIKKSPFMLIIPITLFTLIAYNNAIGLIPYIFTSPSQLIFTVALALPLWLASVTYGWLNNTSNTLVHLIPQRTPTLLMPFIVLIETVRNLIRPLTLAVRLSANIIAGHLLIVLLNSADPVRPIPALPVLFVAKIILVTLETAIAFIQAYVFSVLITLYAAESTN